MSASRELGNCMVQSVENQKKTQEKYLELQMLDNQIRQVQKQLQALESQVQEGDLIQQNLEDLNQVKEGTEILVTLATGIFAKAEIKNTKEVIVNVGAQTAVSKSINDTKDMLARQNVEIRMIQDELNRQLQSVINNARRIEQELQGLMV